MLQLWMLSLAHRVLPKGLLLTSDEHPPQHEELGPGALLGLVASRLPHVLQGGGKRGLEGSAVMGLLDGPSPR